MNEVADTSDAGCGLTAAACTNGNNKAFGRRNGRQRQRDTCDGGTANALVTVPVHTIS
jgi:hypothetical protein